MSKSGEHRRLHLELRTSEGGFAPLASASTAPLLGGLRDAAVQRLRDALPEKAELFERLIVGRGAGLRDPAQRVSRVPIPSIATEHPSNGGGGTQEDVIRPGRRRRVGKARA